MVRDRMAAVKRNICNISAMQQKRKVRGFCRFEPGVRTQFKGNAYREKENNQFRLVLGSKRFETPTRQSAHFPFSDSLNTNQSYPHQRVLFVCFHRQHVFHQENVLIRACTLHRSDSTESIQRLNFLVNLLTFTALGE